MKTLKKLKNKTKGILTCTSCSVHVKENNKKWRLRICFGQVAMFGGLVYIFVMQLMN